MVDKPIWQTMETDWEPTDTDLEWVRNIGRMVKEGGEWHYMDGRYTYVLWPSQKQIKLIRGDIFHEDCLRTTKAFNAIGWTVLLQVQQGGE